MCPDTPKRAHTRILIPGRLKYDHVVHAFGFGTTTWVCWQGLKVVVGAGRVHVEPTLGLMTLAVAAGLGFGALNEVVEFFVTLMVPESNVGGYVNTGWDLVANLVGVTIAIFLIFQFDRGGGPHQPSQAGRVPLGSRSEVVE